MTRENWTSTAIPKELEGRIKEIIEKSKTGYSSITQFVADACRRRLEELERKQEVPAT